MKAKWLLLALSVILSVFLVTACGSDDNNETDAAESENNTDNQENNSEEPENEEPEEATGKYEDGLYFAQADEFGDSGWKYTVTLEVENGNIVDAIWDGAHKDGGVSKLTSSLKGDYGMIVASPIEKEWHEQAEAAEEYLLETQDPTGIEWDDEGKTDAISGCTMTVSDFFELSEKALADGPTERGPYEDGAYYAEAAEFGHSGWKDNASLTVINGNIVAASWNADYKVPADDKRTQAENGDYGMIVASPIEKEWHEQSVVAEDYILETQAPTGIEWDDEGKTDALSGCTMTVSSFFELVEEALDNGPIESGSYSDGTFQAEAEEFGDSGWKDTASVKVMNGTIVSATWNAVNEDGERDKLTEGDDYAMVKASPIGKEWYEQSAEAEKYLLETQDPTGIEWDDEGKTDVISGCTMTVSSFFELVEKALEE